MEHVNGVVSRIQAIEARVRVATPPGDFRQVLERTAGAPTPATAPAASNTRTLQAASDAPAGSISLAQMLGRPITGAAGPGPASPTTDGSISRPGTGQYVLPVDGRLSSTFGPRLHPITGEMRPHRGIDLAAPTGTPIAAMAAGTVTFAGWQNGYGNVVIIQHGNGTETRYAHQDTIGVTAGQDVAAGERIGTVGSTGRSTGPHLHLELRRDGEAVDPAPLLGL